MAAEVPAEVEIIRKPIWEPYQLAEFFGKDNKKFKAGQFDVGKNQSWKARLSIWIRGNFFIPDARVFWVKPSVKFLRKYLEENNFEAFVTTGPPHSVHLIGLHLKKEFPHLKWIADFRDPWTEISYYKHLKLSATSDRKHRKLEQQVFDKADITLATSFSDAENFRRKGANAFCITNGFDVNTASKVVKVNIGENKKFTLSYIGMLEQLRNPTILWKTLNEIITENENFKNDIELKFVGRIDDKILHYLENSGLKNHLLNLGYLPHAEANAEMWNSDLLLLTNFPEETSKGIIPGKIFEYLATGKPIISFGPADSDVKQILTETQAGKHFTYSDEEKVKHFLLDKYAEWKSGNAHANTGKIAQFSRKNLTQKLAELLGL